MQAIPAGAEVLISYLGEKPSKSSTELMKDYGFLMPGNINDTLSFETQGGCSVLLLSTVSTCSMIECNIHAPRWQPEANATNSFGASVEVHAIHAQMRSHKQNVLFEAIMQVGSSSAPCNFLKPQLQQ